MCHIRSAAEVSFFVFRIWFASDARAGGHQLLDNAVRKRVWGLGLRVLLSGVQGSGTMVSGFELRI